MNLDIGQEKDVIQDKEIFDQSQNVAVYSVEEDNIGDRLDYFLSKQYKDISRSYIQKLIKEDRVLVNEKIEKASYKLSLYDQIQIAMPEPELLEVIPQDIPLDIVYEDDDIVIVNKVQGMVVHPAPGNMDNTMVNALMYHCKDRLSNINGIIRPGIVHRIDKDTSGLLVVAKNNYAHQKLSEQFKIHSITREYEMICIGNVDWDEKTIETIIGRNPKNRLKMAVVKKNGKNAITHLKLINNYKGFSHIKANLETGRTHQIRVHTASINRPILGDPLYGFKNKRFSKLSGQVLHARKLGFMHPTRNEYIEFDSELPKYFIETLKILEKE
ncbi:RluA family pseudouridine synthase [Peptostreptococcus equinus]|uniref:Pseudouridine synthase n=1 Tax=Peptostreptococcus equinus TaxID=3003601 RepID=A0ABY7JLM3_9FIRM|nr:RluA family pseudouridine synthase [Peptostreptococcus sp. CBA3647]WAW14244.1 RluA family pseudouridine synthase [Peptostreptococcus sp. CBA3647]